MIAHRQSLLPLAAPRDRARARAGATARRSRARQRAREDPSRRALHAAAKLVVTPRWHLLGREPGRGRADAPEIDAPKVSSSRAALPVPLRHEDPGARLVRPRARCWCLRRRRAGGSGRARRRASSLRELARLHLALLPGRGRCGAGARVLAAGAPVPANEAPSRRRARSGRASRGLKGLDAKLLGDRRSAAPATSTSPCRARSSSASCPPSRRTRSTTRPPRRARAGCNSC